MKRTKNKLVAAAVVLAVLIVAYFGSGPSPGEHKAASLTSETASQAAVTPSSEQTPDAAETGSTEDSHPASDNSQEPGAANGADTKTAPGSAIAEAPAADTAAASAAEPSADETSKPGADPATAGSSGSTVKPAAGGSAKPTAKPAADASSKPASKPDTDASSAPAAKPAADASSQPAAKPSTDASTKPAGKPSGTGKGAANTEIAESTPGKGKDEFQTDAVPAGKPAPVEPQQAAVTDKAMTAYLSVSCLTILDNRDQLDPEKAELVPKDGIIFKKTAVTFYEGESVFNVLQREMKKNKIHMEFENTPIYNSAYIEGIDNLYEFDCGELSGWMYKVNGWFPNYGSSRYQLKQGDVIEWVYTCDLGRDVGDDYNTAGNKKS